MQETLLNVLIFSGIILLIGLSVAVIIGILILIDVKKTSGEVTKKIKAAVCAIDLVGIIRKTVNIFLGK
ncbi:hypothetical protein HZB07_05870 [Candidatus Saganbacteria bacterium]|nr:hypothetical protein [Candidatus Saganbacteria bacterium]